ncbi:metal ABC transporter ATP-binding protein [Streptococcus uberis]|uniref:metal ABC transporter ATP-binding protein n=1 Tax=Streptococcus uberis TaxID=1349 RepID=UPI000E065EDF|nr:metal ABC transporter ATP-binding protein [Streptococcus uberis]SUO89328.1 metal cation ABC transporter ATP-binding protein [Streptococcus uberis]
MITTENLTVTYDNQKEILHQININIESPGIYGILGPNGAGKSTFMKALLNLIHYDGKVQIGKSMKSLPKHQVAYVEQRSNIDLNFPITVRECVSLGTFSTIGIGRCLGKKQYDKVDYYLQEVGLSEYANHSIKALSGGQFQRMLVARCLVQEKDYIFLDEPFVGIDSVSEAIIVKLLKALKEQGKIILVVHHDLSKVETYFDHVILLNQKLMAYGEVSKTFTIDHLSKTYGDELIFCGKE